jgi:Argininosuccinate lyase
LFSILPGFPPFQVAPPFPLALPFFAYVEMIGRDRSRLKDCLFRLDGIPLGSAALAGTSYPIDSIYTTVVLGFRDPTSHAMDSVSDRDFVIGFIFSLSFIGVHLSRLAEGIILWSIPPFNFIFLPDGLSTGSSIMPPIKIPDGAELVRANTSLIIGHLGSILNILKGLPLSYCKALQNDKILIFNSYDNVKLSVKVINETLSKSKFNQLRMKEVIDYSASTATDLANWLVPPLNYTFKNAYKITGKIVSPPTEKN